MVVKCPKCKTELEVSEEFLENNLRCSVCDTKFRLSLTATIDKPERKRVFNFLDKTSQNEINSIIESKGLGKYIKLFRYAPGSIKFIVIYNSFWFLLNFSFAVATKETSSTCGIFYFLALFPLLKRLNLAWRFLLGLYYLTAAFAIIFSIFLFYDRSAFVIGHLIDLIVSLILDIPVFVLLWKQSARQWASYGW